MKLTDQTVTGFIQLLASDAPNTAEDRQQTPDGICRRFTGGDGGRTDAGQENIANLSHRRKFFKKTAHGCNVDSWN